MWGDTRRRHEPQPRVANDTGRLVVVLCGSKDGDRAVLGPDGSVDGEYRPPCESIINAAKLLTLSINLEDTVPVQLKLVRVP